ncbi:MAG TPA: hypothetical protein VGR62_04250 [Candidatus Binatia bacterium]|jgi:cysteine-rich repeat protein|nr:hypothetical protein [Candidatus Binatia bacterium]
MRQRILPLVALSLASLFPARDSWSSCNTIPSATITYRSALGSTDRPYAAPGEFVAIHIRPDECDGASPGFTGGVNDYRVTILFTPLVGPKRAVVLATHCDLSSKLEKDCGIQLGTGPEAVECLPLDAVDDIQIVSSTTGSVLRFRMPNTDALLPPVNDDRTLAGPAAIVVTRASGALACGAGSSRCGSSLTQDTVACIDEFFQADGTCSVLPTPTHRTFPHFTVLPPPNVFAELCDEPTALCSGTATEMRFTVDAAGNLLVPVNWRGVLFRTENALSPIPRLLHGSVAIDAFAGQGSPVHLPNNEFIGSFTPEGAPLPPLLDPQIAPAGTIPTEAGFYGSADAPYSVLRLTPLSPNASSCDGASPEPGLPCTRNADCAPGQCAPARCEGGNTPGSTCVTDGDCPGVGARCVNDGTPLFDLADRAVAPGGPVVIPRSPGAGDAGVCRNAPAIPCATDATCGGNGPCVGYRLSADTPFTLQGLVGTDDLVAFTVDERLLQEDRNGDLDTRDVVVQVRDRATGATMTVPGDAGHALTRARFYSRYRFPLLSADEDLVAFVEPEQLQGLPNQGSGMGFDASGNHQIFEGLLRVYRRTVGPGGPALADVLPANAQWPVAAGGAINLNVLGVSSPLVFYLHSERDVLGRKTELITVPASPTSPPMDSQAKQCQLAPDAQVVSFDTASRLVDADVGTHRDVYLRDRLLGTTERISVTLDSMAPSPNGESLAGGVSLDNRFVVFASDAPNLVPGFDNGQRQVYVRDRCIARGEGLGNCTPSTEIVSVSTGGVRGDKLSGHDGLTAGVISWDGRYVLFDSSATNLVPLDTNGAQDVFLRDRCVENGNPVNFCTPSTVRVSVASDGSQGMAGKGSFSAFSLSGENLRVAFNTEASLVEGDTNEVPDTYVRQLVKNNLTVGTTTRVSVTSVGGQITTGVPLSDDNVAISSDGRFVAFVSIDPAVVPGDTNGLRDAFVHDTASGVTARVVTASDENPNGVVNRPLLNDNGDVVVFSSTATNFVGDDGNHVRDTFYASRATGMVMRTSVDANEHEVSLPSESMQVSRDGSTILLRSPNALDPDAETMNGVPNCYIRAFDLTGAPPDASGDGDYGDGVVFVFDASTGTQTAICEGSAVSTNGPRAAFLHPTDDSIPCWPLVAEDAANDPGKNVVHLYTHGSGSQSYRCAASRVAMSDTIVAAGTFYQGNVPMLAYRRLADGQPATCAAWTHLPIPVLLMNVLGDRIAVQSPEATGDVSGDGDSLDNVLRIYDAAVGAELPVTDALAHAVPASDVVMSPEVVAFRTLERSLCDHALGVTADTCDDPTPCALTTCDLNHDGDCCDSVLQAYDYATATVVSSGQAVTPCPFDACDPRFPYRVSGSTIRFLTYEPDQGDADLDGNGLHTDYVIQTFNPRVKPAERVRPLTEFARTEALTAFPLVSTASGDPLDAASSLQLADTGATVLVGHGVCVEPRGGSCTDDADCALVLDGATGDSCTSGGTCEREHGTCRDAADCELPTVCDLTRRTVPASADDDGDGVSDALDKCPHQPNTEQADADDDGVGDACDVQECGNGAIDGSESCDDGNLASGDGCEPGCTHTVACVGGTTMTAVKATLTRLGSSSGGMVFSGKLLFGPGTPAPGSLALHTRGFQLRVEDLGGGSRTVVDLSHWTTPVPGNPSPCDTRDLWKVNASGTTFSYSNKSGRLPPSCAPGSARGLQKLKVVDRRSAGGTVELKVTMKNAALGTPAGPLRFTVGLGADAASSTQGACGTHAFALGRCTLLARDTRMVCK